MFSAAETKIDVEDVFNIDAADKELRDLLETWYMRNYLEMHVMTQQVLGIDFNLDDPVTRDFLKDAGNQIRNIQDTTKNIVRRELTESQTLGEGVQETANRLRNSAAFSPARARTIARTEMGHATNTGALYVYRQSNLVTDIQVWDSDKDEDCAYWNGRIVSLQMAGSVPTLSHPNCVRAFGAVVSKGTEEEDA